MEALLFVRGLVIHLICDWLLQNDWMVANKSDMNHNAGIIHAGIHVVGLMMVFPANISTLIGVSHYLVDLRFVLKWWRSFFGQTVEGDVALHVAFWGDQVVHIVIIWIASWWVAKRSR